MSLSLKARVTAFTGVVSVLIAALAIATAWIFTETRANGIEAIERLQPAAAASTQLIVGTGDMERGVSAYAQTGLTESLAPYAEGAAMSAAAIDNVRASIEDTNPAIAHRLDLVAAARNDWLSDVARPMIGAVRSGNAQQAQEIQTGPASVARLEILRAQELALDADINSALAAESAQIGVGASWLAVTLVALYLLLIVIIVGANWAVRRDVLRPLLRLRTQLRTVANGEFEHVVIATSGPPELREVGRDAEAMRRQLVDQIDDAREARLERESEAEVVSAIRTSLQARTINVPGVDVAGDQQTAEGLSGDWWDALPLPGGRVAVVITDISGHGWPAGIAGLRLKDRMLSELAKTHSPAAALGAGVEEFADADALFATVAVVVIDPKARSIQWANAGHLPPMICHEDYSITRLDVTGPLLSTIGGVWETRTVEFTSSDCLVMWTDGVTESVGFDGEQLEDDGLIAQVIATVSSGSHSSSEIVESVLAHARAQSIDWSRDDATLIVGQLTALS